MGVRPWDDCPPRARQENVYVFSVYWFFLLPAQRFTRAPLTEALAETASENPKPLRAVAPLAVAPLP